MLSHRRDTLERRHSGDGRFGSCALPDQSFRLNDIDSGTHFLARRVALDPSVLERQVLQRALAVPAFFALDPIPIGPIPRCRAGHDEIETIPKPTEKTTVNALNSGERR
jgi:hypothetical protein